MTQTILQAQRAVNRPFLATISQVLLGAIVIMLSSKLYIPLSPVPITFQSITVVLIGMLVGPKQGVSMVLTYLLAGLAGVPVFAGWLSGPAMLLGPTGGYLLGFLPAVMISGYLAQRGCSKRIFSCFAAAFLSTTALLAMGVLYLSTFVGFKMALETGLYPFLAIELIKLCLISLFVPYCKTR